MPQQSDLERRKLEQANENRTVRRIVTVILLIFIILFAGFSVGSFFYVSSALKPIDEKDKKKIDVTIPIGSSVSEIAKLLEKQGAIKNALIFRYYVKYKNESGFQAGDYELNTAMDVKDIISELKEGKVKKEVALKLTVPEGLGVTGISKLIAKNTSYSEEEIMNKMQDKDFIEMLASTYSILDEKAISKDGIKYSLEGYLFPATYEFEDKNPKLETIISSMVEKMQEIVEKYEGEIRESGFSIHETLTLASLIEKETQKSEDRFKVSGVFHNRMEKDMRLDSDPTVKYALDKNEIQVTYKDTDVSSPYNTYRMKGLPIGPIASPREESIKAAIEPKQVDEYYFFARPNGEVIYTKTLSEHEKVVAKYRHEWNELIKAKKAEKKK
ncbi:endolytic transglycosylase MltG [Pueribacillus theae]|uniref:endolytic transglycosylase MltG n=1 Tax=Pueribacillus theae TaxID=2171751 RepID=UPI001403D435|nr:endolytic transglycosylase MltG [Pueribacillus theae]